VLRNAVLHVPLIVDLCDLQVAQIYKDPSVGNPVSVAVVKVEILKVRRTSIEMSEKGCT
jgi:hypothetical protein